MKERGGTDKEEAMIRRLRGLCDVNPVTCSRNFRETPNPFHLPSHPAT